MKKTLLLMPLAAMAGSCGPELKQYQYVEGRRNAETQEIVFDTVAFEAKNDTAAYVEMYKRFMESSQKRRNDAMKPMLCNLLDERDSMPFKDYESLESMEFRTQMQERARKELNK
jgi:hypothetical protein